MKKMLIVTACDDTYLRLAEIALGSAMRKNRFADYMLIYLGERTVLPEFFYKNGISIYFVKEPEILSVKNRYPPASFAKLLLFKIYFKKWKTILYLDADTYTDKECSFLPLSNLHGFFAVKDNHCIKENFTVEGQKQLSINLGASAFNAGVFVFSTDLIKSGSYDRLCQLIDQFQDSSIFGDNGILNLFFYEKWTSLSGDYNVFVQGSWNENPAGKVLHFAGKKDIERLSDIVNDDFSIKWRDDLEIEIYTLGGLGDLMMALCLARHLRDRWPLSHISLVSYGGRLRFDLLYEQGLLNIVYGLIDEVRIVRSYPDSVAKTKDIIYYMHYFCCCTSLYSPILLYHLNHGAPFFNKIVSGVEFHKKLLISDEDYYDKDLFISLNKFFSLELSEESLADMAPAFGRYLRSRLNKLSIGKSYMSIHVSPSGGISPIKSWSFEKWESLVSRLNMVFPDLVIIQFLEGSEQAVPGTLEMRGRPYSQVLSLLSNSLLHIDIEGGMVHASSFLGNPCICINGPVAPFMFPINGRITVVEHKVCPYQPCQKYRGFNGTRWTTSAKCLGDQECMNSISVDDVFDVAVKMISSRIKRDFLPVD